MPARFAISSSNFAKRQRIETASRSISAYRPRGAVTTSSSSSSYERPRMATVTRLPVRTSSHIDDDLNAVEFSIEEKERELERKERELFARIRRMESMQENPARRYDSEYEFDDLALKEAEIVRKEEELRRKTAEIESRRKVIWPKPQPQKVFPTQQKVYRPPQLSRTEPEPAVKVYTPPSQKPKISLRQRVQETLQPMTTSSETKPTEIIEVTYEPTQDLETEMEKLHKRNETDKMIALLQNSQNKGITPSPKSYVYLIKSLSLEGSSPKLTTAIESIIQDDQPITKEQYSEIFFAISQSSAKIGSSIVKLYQHGLNQGHDFSDPLTYKVLISCCNDPNSTMTIFKDMKKNKIGITASLYLTMLKSVATHLANSSVIVTDMKQSGVSLLPLTQNMNLDEVNDLLSLMKKVGLKITPQEALPIIKQAINSNKEFETYTACKSVGGKLTEDIFNILLGRAIDRHNVNLGKEIWRDAIMYNLKVPEKSFVGLLKLLSSAFDTEIFELFNGSREAIPPSINVYLMLLQVSSKHSDANAAKDIWREMQSTNTHPSVEILELMLDSLKTDKESMQEVLEVMRLSELEIPPKSVTLINSVLGLNQTTKSQYTTTPNTINYSTPTQPATTAPYYPKPAPKVSARIPQPINTMPRAPYPRQPPSLAQRYQPPQPAPRPNLIPPSRGLAQPMYRPPAAARPPLNTRMPQQRFPLRY